MKEVIEVKLQSMLNKSYKYGIRVVTFTGYRFDEVKEKVYLHTNEKQDHWDRPYGSVMTFLKEFEPSEPPAKDNSTQLVVSNTSNIVESLRMTLLENIEAVKKDKGYIPQATAINNNVNSIINLSKLQMEALKMQQKFKNEG